ncbi:MAG: VWA domain-containing protein [Pirellulales bacterium]|nr:VWA domain-containing protein [Pirellulales bacterium]
MDKSSAVAVEDRLDNLKARAHRRQRLMAQQRRGAIIVLTALLMTAMLGMLAFAVDVGYIELTETELRRSVDAGVMAGAGELVNGDAGLQDAVMDVMNENYVAGSPLPVANVNIELGHWDTNTRLFSVSNSSPSAVRVTGTQNNCPLFFGSVFGQNQFSISAHAVAQFQPRDIMLVLDLSGSMGFDSMLQAYTRSPSSSRLTESDVKANMQTIWNQLVAQGHIPSNFDNKLTWNGKYISSSSTNKIKKKLGLKNVSWPFSAGSWSGYKNHVRGDSYVNSAGYRRDYGKYTMLDYLLDRMDSYSNQPMFDACDVQPLKAVKNAVDVFISYIQAASTDDQVGLAVYSSSSGGGYLESGLTGNLTTIANIAGARQHGHYSVYTNIGDGLQTAITELQNNARTGSFKMIVVMTDGVANRPTSTSVATAHAIAKANVAAAAGIPVVTISLGASADTATMQTIADNTGGVHFNIPGGQPVADYEDDLEDAFREIAGSVPLKLVQ